MKKAEQDIQHINYYVIQRHAFKVINEFVNKLEHFDADWFKILVDSYPAKAIYKLNNIDQWKFLCIYQYGKDDYTRWYNTAVTWYNEYNTTTTDNHTRLNAFYEKVYYMHKSKGLHLIA